MIAQLILNKLMYIVTKKNFRIWQKAKHVYVPTTGDNEATSKVKKSRENPTLWGCLEKAAEVVCG